jgi:hypothetical protein
VCGGLVGLLLGIALFPQPAQGLDREAAMIAGTLLGVGLGFLVSLSTTRTGTATAESAGEPAASWIDSEGES